MPRPVDESKLRRFMMQGIMWVILGATVGLAALVTHTKQSSLKVVLDEPKKFDGFSIRLPKGWTDNPDDPRNVIDVQNPDLAEELKVSLRRPSLREVMSRFTNEDDGRLGSVSIDGQNAQIKRQLFRSDEDGMPFMELSATRVLGDGRELKIVLLVEAMSTANNRRALDHEIDLIKQVAGSVHLDAGPTTEPQQ